MGRKKRSVCQSGRVSKPRARAEWERLVSEWMESGSTAEEFCRRKRDLKARTLKWWAWNLRATNEATASGKAGATKSVVTPSRGRTVPSFLPVSVTHQEVTGFSLSFEEESSALQIELRQRRRINVHGAFDPAVLRDIVIVLEGVE